MAVLESKAVSVNGVPAQAATGLKMAVGKGWMVIALIFESLQPLSESKVSLIK
jgi:hypothetical protein